jgi:hypothetical protein
MAQCTAKFTLTRVRQKLQYHRPRAMNNHSTELLGMDMVLSSSLHATSDKHKDVVANNPKTTV